ncbi:hypothetical protein [Kribbella solani]|uniref:Vacuolar-type H+-ATPase subunit H n=1 Tax=Kribbella solani TaxID=236067 RepID=A0A841DSZ1_9ACTN|nr:hypothetical protein [Kribbella solani]MBB5978478.1 vacuolar-type H+-ATPase subunit H [Kribbella solani]
MSTMLDRLWRFRPVGAPGGAGPVGVPEDARSGVPAELAGVFVALDATIAECDEVRAHAGHEAAGMVAAARTDAAALVAAARTQAVGERAEIAAAIQARGDAEVARTRATATEDTGDLRQAGSQRMDDFVALVLDRLRADVQGLVR